MGSPRQKEIKVAHLEKQVERIDKQITKAKAAVEAAQASVAELQAKREKAVERLEWQKAEPVSDQPDDEDDEVVDPPGRGDA